SPPACSPSKCTPSPTRRCRSHRSPGATPPSSKWCRPISTRRRSPSAARPAVDRCIACTEIAAVSTSRRCHARLRKELSMLEQTNPLREGLTGERVPLPCTMVIFGASGDLTKRKLVPALYSLARDRLLPSAFSVLGVARRDIGDQGFREQM